MSNYQEYLTRGRSKYGDKFDTSELSKQFSRFYHSGTRLKVLWGGEEVTGTIGATTGWKPAFLLMRTSRSTGSPYVLSDRDSIVAVKYEDDRNYRPYKERTP